MVVRRPSLKKLFPDLVRHAEAAIRTKSRSDDRAFIIAS